MTLTINDTRNNQKGILWESLEAGHVYIDKNGWYVMAVENGFDDYAVKLDTGELLGESIYDQQYDRFTEVKVKLEVFG